MARKFSYEGKEYPDLDPKMSIDDVRQSMANFFPELSNAEATTVKKGDDEITTFKKRVGTKGAAKPPDEMVVDDTHGHIARLNLVNDRIIDAEELGEKVGLAVQAHDVVVVTKTNIGANYAQYVYRVYGGER